MINIIIYICMFFIGIFFGSFFTLAVYRIPLGKDILYTHSYCPNCKHKLGILDLFPIFSYIALGGKCRYCNEKIRPRYLILELLSGIVFVLFAMSFNLNKYIIEPDKIIYMIFGILYLASIFIIAGIDKERCQIQSSVLIYGIVISIIKVLYSYFIEKAYVLNYVIALIALVILFIAYKLLLKEDKFKNSIWNYTSQIVILALYMLIVTGRNIFMQTLISILLALVLYIIIEKIARKGETLTKEEKDKKFNNIPIGYMFCVLNIVWVLIFNFLWNYIV